MSYSLNTTILPSLVLSIILIATVPPAGTSDSVAHTCTDPLSSAILAMSGTDSVIAG